MADRIHLDEFVAQEADPLARALLEQFAKIARNQSVSPTDYPTRVRLLLNALFNGLIDASTRSHDS
jgi:hypothetical protein